MTRKERVKQLKGNRRQDTTLANLNTGNTRRFTRMIIDNELSSNDEEQRLGAVRKLGKIAGKKYFLIWYIRSFNLRKNRIPDSSRQHDQRRSGAGTSKHSNF